MRKPHFTNVKEFGAIGDGVANDRAAIQAALDRVETDGGGVVFMPRGQYYILANAFREGLYIGDNTVLTGEGISTELLFEGDPVLSSSALVCRNSSGQLTAAQQRVGNFNVHYRDFKITDLDNIEFKNIMVGMGGVEHGSINNVWVENCGGYSVLIGRTNNDDGLIGRDCKNIHINNLRITGFQDQGLEIWGGDGIHASNIHVEGPGVSTGYGQGVLVWNGAKNVKVSNVTVMKDESIPGRKVAALGIGGWGDVPGTVTGERKTENIYFDNVYGVTDVGIRCNIVNVDTAIVRCDNINIRNSDFISYDGSDYSGDIRNTKGFNVHNTRFLDFLEHFQFTNPGSTTLQNTVSDVEIKDCRFEGGEKGIAAFGITDLRLIDNRFYNIPLGQAVDIRGGEYFDIIGNKFHNIGSVTTGLQYCINLQQLNASSVKETTKGNVFGNTVIDDRATKYTHNLVQAFNATDIITLGGNNLRLAEKSAEELGNSGSGTNIRREWNVYTPNNLNGVNVASIVWSDSRYFRVGDLVTCFGKVNVTASGAGATSFMISIPPEYNSQIFNAEEMAGNASSGVAANTSARLSGDGPNNAVKMEWVATDGSAYDWNYIFSFLVRSF